MLTYKIGNLYTKDFNLRHPRPVDIFKEIQQKNQKIENAKKKIAAANRLTALINKNLKEKGVIRVGNLK